MINRRQFITSLVMMAVIPTYAHEYHRQVTYNEIVKNMTVQATSYIVDSAVEIRVNESLPAGLTLDSIFKQSQLETNLLDHSKQSNNTRLHVVASNIMEQINGK